MPENPNKLVQLWQELKRRRVIHVIIVYATAAFVIIELINNVFEPLHLPDWTPTMVIVILAIGFPIALIFSWIFDVTSEGIEKTKSSKEVWKGEKTATPNSWKIATYVSVVIIIGLLSVNIFGRRSKTRIDPDLEKSIAVIPFQNFSVDADQEYMCLGLTDEIINHLFKIESFDKVISLNSVLTYIGTDKKIPQIADELEVTYILEGTYKKIGNQVRVTAQLIEAGTDKHLWQHEYDRPYEEIIEIQADIAFQIADHVKVFISGPEKQRIQKVPTTNQEAYELMQQAQYLFTTKYYNKRDQIIRLAQKAIDLDPDYADAYAMIGAMILSEGYYFGGKEMQSVAWEALSYINKALELDTENVQAIISISAINLFVQWDYIKVEKDHSKIAYCLSSHFYTFIGYMTFIIEMGRFNEVLAIIDKSEYKNYGIVTRAHILLGNNQEAYNLIEGTLNKYGRPKYPEIGELYNWLGEYDSARYYLESAMQLKDPKILTPRFQADLAVASYHTGAQKQARTIIDQLIRKNDTTSVGSPAFFTGWYYSWIGEVDSAFFWLEKAYHNRSPEMPWLKVNPAFKSLKEDDRYWDLYERTGHKAYDDYMASRN